MKRRSVHALFAATISVIALVTVYNGVALYRATRVNEAITGADERVRQSQHLNVAFESRQTRLADGLALARAQKYDAAFKAFNGLITPGAKDEAAQAALYDLGNMYLRQALAHAGEDPTLFIPLVELAKQRYRDLLRLYADDWDARYNLERALRLAPEDHLAFALPEAASQERRQILGGAESVTPDLP